MPSPLQRPADPKIRRAAESLGRELDLRLVVLFGSAATGDRPPEDIDLALLGEGILDTVDLTNRFATALARNDVDVVDLRRADPLVLMQVAEHGIPLFEHEPGAFTSFYSLAFRRFVDTRKFRQAEREALHEYIEREVRRS